VIIADSIINLIFRGQSISQAGKTASWDAPPSLFIGLLTASAEVTGTGYARVEVASTAGNWADPAGTGTTSNVNAVTFPAPTAAWGTVTRVGVFDALTGGSMIAAGNLTTPLVVMAGDTPPEFPAGELVYG
jgi:hypothetical protein